MLRWIYSKLVETQSETIKTQDKLLSLFREKAKAIEDQQLELRAQKAALEAAVMISGQLMEDEIAERARIGELFNVTRRNLALFVVVSLQLHSLFNLMGLVDIARSLLAIVLFYIPDAKQLPIIEGMDELDSIREELGRRSDDLRRLLPADPSQMLVPIDPPPRDTLFIDHGPLQLRIRQVIDRFRLRRNSN